MVRSVLYTAKLEMHRVETLASLLAQVLQTELQTVLNVSLRSRLKNLHACSRAPPLEGALTQTVRAAHPV